jgi:hypothetical protein
MHPDKLISVLVGIVAGGLLLLLGMFLVYGL